MFAYATSPARDLANAGIADRYWTDPAVGKLPYYRGRLLAARWNHRLRAATGGARDLDDVVRAMRAKARAGTDALDAAALFPPTYRELGGPDLAPELASLVERGARVMLPADAFGPCLAVVTDRRPAFERGWDFQATEAAGGVVVGLRRGSAAYRAGLRDGMKLVARTAGEPGDATIRYELQVLDGARPRTISFLPAGPDTVDVQRLTITPTGRTTPTCTP